MWVGGVGRGCVRMGGWSVWDECMCVVSCECVRVWCQDGCMECVWMSACVLSVVCVHGGCVGMGCDRIGVWSVCG